MEIVIVTSRAKCASHRYCDMLKQHLRSLFPDYNFSVKASNYRNDGEIVAMPVLKAADIPSELMMEQMAPDLLDDVIDAVKRFDLTASWRVH